jgi:hypothetical protein
MGGWFSLRSKNKEYEQHYFRNILERRMAAYEEVGRLIANIKVAVIDVDQRPYHLMFSCDEDQANVYQALLGTMSNTLWLTDDLFDLTRQLNIMVFSGTSNGDGLIEFGKKHYQQIAELRTQLERLHYRDMMNLHDIQLFLKHKKPHDFYEPLPQCQKQDCSTKPNAGV